MFCLRCHEGHYRLGDGRCDYCGVHKDRPVRHIRRRNIGGKRGRNSGAVRSSKKKK